MNPHYAKALGHFLLAFGQVKYGDGPTEDDARASDSSEGYGSRGRASAPRAKKSTCCIAARRAKKVPVVPGGDS